MDVVAEPEAIEEARRLVGAGLELISDEARWTRNAYARDGRGRRVEPGSRRPRPVAWCLAGCLLEAEQRTAIAKGDAYETPESVLSRPSARFSLAVTATWLSCEHAFWDEPGTGWTLERALRFTGVYLDSLPGQIACAMPGLSDAADPAELRLFTSLPFTAPSWI
jgi:hypothetical protein